MTIRNLVSSAPLLALGCLLALLFLPSCAAEPPKPKSMEEMAQETESKAQEHRVYYEGWLHPSGN